MASNIEIHEEQPDAQSESTSLQPVHPHRDSLGNMVHGTVDYLERRLSSPKAAALVVGGVAIGAALLFGVGPTVVGAGAGYAAYRMIQKRRPKRDDSTPSTSKHPIGGA